MKRQRTLSRAPTTQLVTTQTTQDVPMVQNVASFRRYKQLRNKTGPVNLGLGFPKKVKEIHKYAEIVTVSTGASGSTDGVYTFSANGMYDPNITGTGHQPMYFDQLGALYNHYCVVSSKISVKVVPIQGGPAMVVALYVNDDTTVTPNIYGQIENSNCSFKNVPFNNQDTIVLNQKWSAAKYFGKNPLSNTELQGTTAANPTEQSYYTFTLNSSATATAASVQVLFYLEYTAVWKELKDIASS